jgi:hypothetical protein
MNKYTIKQQAAISDIIFNYPFDSYADAQSLLESLGFDLTLDEIESEYNSRV